MPRPLHIGRGIFVCIAVRRLEFLQLQLLNLHFAAAFDDAHAFDKLWCCRVFGKGFFAFPSFAEHKDILASGTFKDIIGNHAFVFLCLGCEQNGCVKGFVVLSLLCLEKTVQSYHSSIFLFIELLRYGRDVDDVPIFRRVRDVPCAHHVHDARLVLDGDGVHVHALHSLLAFRAGHGDSV